MLFLVAIATHVNGTVNNKLVVQANSYGMAFADVDVKMIVKHKILLRKAEIVTTYHEGIEPDKNKEEDGEISSKNRTSC